MQNGKSPHIQKLWHLGGSLHRLCHLKYRRGRNCCCRGKNFNYRPNTIKNTYGGTDITAFCGYTCDSGAYAVYINNRKIHITGKCSSTGNRNNAMKPPVYFDTYYEAETYFAKKAPSLDKRQCGNCWWH